MPDIRPGSVIEYSYSINSPFLGNIEEIDLQYDIPVKKIEVQVESPEYFVFKPLMKGYYPFQIISDSKRESVNITSKDKTVNFHGRNGYNNTRLDYTTNISKIDLENVPALKEEPYVNNINNYRSAIRYELQYVQFPQTPIKYILRAGPM